MIKKLKGYLSREQMWELLNADKDTYLLDVEASYSPTLESWVLTGTQCDTAEDVCKAIDG